MILVSGVIPGTRYDNAPEVGHPIEQYWTRLSPVILYGFNSILINFVALNLYGRNVFFFSRVDPCLCSVVLPTAMLLSSLSVSLTLNPPRHLILSPGSYGDTLAWSRVSVYSKRTAVSMPRHNELFKDTCEISEYTSCGVYSFRNV